MSPTGTRLATVRTAQRRGPDRPSEDRIFTTTNAVVVLDGASQPNVSDHDGGWLAETLGRQLMSRLDGDDLAEVLREAIATVAAEHLLVPGVAPSTTVAIVRWNTEMVEALVLGDSPVIALTRGGEIIEVRDDRIRRVATGERNDLTPGGFRTTTGTGGAPSLTPNAPDATSPADTGSQKPSPKPLPTPSAIAGTATSWPQSA